MKTIKMVTTVPSEKKYWLEEETEITKVSDCMHVVEVYPDLKEQTMQGFGGAFTEASVHNWEGLSEKKQAELINAYFGEEGLRYNMGRVHINSCDFALGNYTYVKEGDETLQSFDISHDKRKMIPMIKEAIEVVEKKNGSGITFMAAPWSPPAYMKTNGEMNHGGKLRADYYELWAEYFVKYLRAYKEEGVQISYITVQNEPEAVQTWDSCVYDAKEEGVFIRDFLSPALNKAGFGNIKIFIWDHNKESMYRRAKESFSVEGCEAVTAGIAVHWYTGDHFDAIRAVKKAYPEKAVFFTEGCVEYSRFADTDETNKAEMYAHDMLGNFKAGVEAFLDWNLLLDEKGGPNHVGNFCAAPIMCDGAGDIARRLSYYYIGHFSRYIQRGAKQILTSSYTDTLETVAFLNPDGSKAVVVLNRGNKDLDITLREKAEGLETMVKAHSIVTFLY